MFEGMVALFLVYHGANILPFLCRCGIPIVHVGGRDVEHAPDTALADAVRKLAGDSPSADLQSLKSLFANQNAAVSIAANRGRACHQRDNRVGTRGIRLRASVLSQ